MKSIPIIIVFCVVITLTSTKKLNTLCPEKEVIKNFQIENYFGKWFVINRYDDSQTKRTPKCIVSEYFRDDSDNGTIKTRLTFLDDSNVWQTSESNFIKPSDGEIVPNYNILETDYKNYSIVWKCRNTGENQSEGNYIIGFFHLWSVAL